MGGGGGVGLQAVFPARADGEKSQRREGIVSRLGTSINMFKYLTRFSLITAFVTPGCDDASGSDHFRAGVETTADVIPRIRRPGFGPASDDTVHHSDTHGSAHQLCSPPPRQTYFECNVANVPPQKH